MPNAEISELPGGGELFLFDVLDVAGHFLK